MALADRSRLLRVAVSRIAHTILGSRLDATISAEALAGAERRELKRTLEMLKWASAVAGNGDFPRWFPAAYHVTDPESRASSAVALRRYLTDHPDAGEFLWRQLFAFESNSDLDELRTFVDADLRGRLDSSPPADAPGVERGEPPSVAVLTATVSVLAELGARPFLVSGTLLGYVRSGQILAHDYDIDLGLLPGDGDWSLLADALRSAGFDVSADARKIVCRDENDAAVDIFLHYERDGLIWHGTDIHEWWNSPFTLEPATFMGVDVWVPDDPPRYLSENYGDWTRPVAFYNFSFDTPNRVYRKTPEALLYLHKRFVRALMHGDRWTAESCARELRDVFEIDLADEFNPTPLLEAGRQAE